MEKDQRRGLENHRINMTIDESGGGYLYTLGSHDTGTESRMVEENEGFVIKSGEIETASGHRFYALLEFCAPDSYEHYATGVVVPGATHASGEDGGDSPGFPQVERFVQDPTSGQEGVRAPAVRILWQGEEDFLAWIEEAKKSDPSFEFYPYRYLYYDESARAQDHHVGPFGWSA